MPSSTPLALPLSLFLEVGGRNRMPPLLNRDRPHVQWRGNPFRWAQLPMAAQRDGRPCGDVTGMRRVCKYIITLKLMNVWQVCGENRAAHQIGTLLGGGCRQPGAAGAAGPGGGN